MSRVVASIRARGEVVTDALLAAALTLVGWLQIALLPVFFKRPDQGAPGGPAVGGRFDPNRAPFLIKDTLAGPLDYVLIAACFLPLTLRRRYPLTVLAVVTLAVALFDRFQHPPTITFLAPLIALYTVGSLKDRKTLAVAGVLAASVTIAASMPSFSDVRFFADIARTVSMFGVAAALGVAASNQRAYVAEVEARLEESERTREEEARRRVDEERLRIARELHDITAHSLSIIAVQAGAAERVLLRDPGSAAHALVTIRETASRSLDELRSLVGVSARRRGRLGIRPRPARAAAQSARAARPGEVGRGLRAFGCTSMSTRTSASCRRSWTSRHTVSCRRRSPTWYATPMPPRLGFASGATTARW